MKAIILGTGATIGTIGAEAGVVGFVRRLAAVRSNWRAEYPLLAEAIDDCGGDANDVGLDQIWTRLDYYSKFSKIFGTVYSGDVSTQLHKAILDAYAFAEDIGRICSAPSEYALKSVLAKLLPGETLISFNWDTLAETILCDVLGAKVVQVPHAASPERIRLAKPHGSLSWVHRNAEPILYRDETRLRLIAMSPAEVYSGMPGSCQPLILGALPIKSELLDEVQTTEPGLHDLIVGQWTEVMDAISRCTELIIVGYRFPPEDEYGRFLLREAVKKRAAGLPLSLRYFSLARDREVFERAFRDVFGSSVSYSYCGEVTTAFRPMGAAG